MHAKNEGMSGTSSIAAGDTRKIDVGVRGLTRDEMQHYADQKHVEVWEFKMDTSKAWKPWLFDDVAALKCLLRQWFVDLLEAVPEATDRQLRGLLLEEHGANDKVRFFVQHYISHAMSATSRWIVDQLFDQSLSIIAYAGTAMRESKGNDLKFKEKMAKFIQDKRIKYSAREFEHLVALDEFPCDPFPSDLRPILAERRASGMRPGKGLLQRPAAEVIAEHDAAMTKQFKQVKRGADGRPTRQ